MTVTASVLAGYDDGRRPSGPAVVPLAMASGSSGNVDAGLDYLHGNALRSVRVDSAASLVAYPGYLDRPALGATATVAGQTTTRWGLTLSASQRVGYEPFFNPYSAGISSAPFPAGMVGADSRNGLLLRRSVSSGSVASVDRVWSRRNSTSITCSYGLQRFMDSNRGDNRSRGVVAKYRRKIAVGLVAGATYAYSAGEYVDYEAVWRVAREHRIEGGPEIETWPSRRRHLTLSLSGGASRIDSLIRHSWLPIGSASAALGLSSRWSVDGGYRRGLSPLQGITDELYTTDSAFAGIRGAVAARIDLKLAVAYSNWKTVLTPGVRDRFDVYSTSLQLDVALTRTLAVTAAYAYYYHRYSNPGVLSPGFPARYDRHSIRFGFAMNLPLVSTVLAR